MSSVLLGQPFDIVKIRLQAQSSVNPLYKTPFHWIRAIVHNEGFKAFYKGTAAPFFAAGIWTSIRFWVNDATKKGMKHLNYLRGRNNPDLVTSAQLTFWGAAAGVANAFVTTPIEHSRILLQAQNSLTDPRFRFKGSIDALIRVFQDYGFKEVYRGFWITMVRDIAFFAVFFGVYDIIKNKTCDTTHRPNLPWLMVLGSIWGVLSWIPAYSFDVVKTKIQLEPFLAPCFWGWKDWFRKTYSKEGIKGFTMGLGPCLARTTITSSCVIGVYEVVLRYLDVIGVSYKSAVAI
jgi:solute carrier family 25 (mitochondrial carnitine/acylcarnitine transporter), member 20/29